MIRFNWDERSQRKYYRRNFKLIKDDYQVLKTNEFVLASGHDIKIYLASAGKRCEFEIINVSIATLASIDIITTGRNLFVNGESSIILASRGDILCGFGDGRNSIVIDKLKRGVEISW